MAKGKRPGDHRKLDIQKNSLPLAMASESDGRTKFAPTDHPAGKRSAARGDGSGRCFDAAYPQWKLRGAAAYLGRRGDACR